MGMGGKADAGEGQEQDLRENSAFSEFLQPNFNVADFASSALADSSASAQVWSWVTQAHADFKMYSNPI